MALPTSSRGDGLVEVAGCVIVFTLPDPDQIVEKCSFRLDPEGDGWVGYIGALERAFSKMAALNKRMSILHPQINGTFVLLFYDPNAKKCSERVRKTAQRVYERFRVK